MNDWMKIQEEESKERLVLEVVLPFPLVTWNRLLAMHHWQRKKLRDWVHAAVIKCVNKEDITQEELDEYYQIIRPKPKSNR